MMRPPQPSAGVKPVAEAVADYIGRSTTTGTSIAVFGPWGLGKSSFMRMVEGALLYKSAVQLLREAEQRSCKSFFMMNKSQLEKAGSEPDSSVAQVKKNDT